MKRLSFKKETWISFAFLGFAAALALLLPHVETYFYIAVVTIPITASVTACLTYWVVSRRKVVPAVDKSNKRQEKLKFLSKLEHVSVQDLFDDLPIALLRVSKDGKIKQTNQFSRSILGIREGECPNISEIASGLAKPVPEWLEELTERAARGKPKLVQVTGPKSEVFLHVSLMSMDPRGGSDLIAVISDATELKTLEAQFVQSQKMQAIGQLAGGVAHDFNNLLTAISGYCDLLLLRHDKGDPDYSDLIQIHQNANRAAALVGQLLAFSRKQTLQPNVLNVDEALADMTHLLNRLLGAKIELTLEHAENLPNVYVDKRQLEQVVMNLVVNARDAMPDGGQVGITTFEVVFPKDTVKDGVTIPKGRYVEIMVADNGCGIAAAHVPSIFDPFFTTKDVGEGTGLGLSTVYGIVKQTGGYIFVESIPGKGTSFYIILPVTNHVETDSVVQTDDARPISQSLKGTTVLLVEDEVPVRSFAARALALQDVTVLEAGSGEEAMKIVEDTSLHIDIFVSDVVMPGEDGPTWVRKALEKRPDTKVIFVSGYAEETFSQDFGAIHGAKFIPKPFTLSKLIQTVRDLQPCL